MKMPIKSARKNPKVNYLNLTQITILSLNLTVKHSKLASILLLKTKYLKNY